VFTPRLVFCALLHRQDNKVTNGDNALSVEPLYANKHKIRHVNRFWIVSSIVDMLNFLGSSIQREANMELAHHRHDISDRVWQLLEPRLLGRKGTWGGNARDNRQFINAVFWILRTGAPWRDLPADYGDWKNTHRRFCRWRDKRVWEDLLEALIEEADFEWLMIDVSHIKVHPHAAGARGGHQEMRRTKGDSTQDIFGRGCE
jgi:transposase